ncbi:type III pantothenate kinase [Undibacterium curvum]|uniref:type III pantothenate kinase n=1 Tax=Undibacterium curvum TaxID=2762294 RepID=UPI003D0DA508
MLLLIDAGNTRVKWAMHPRQPALAAQTAPQWLQLASVAHADIAQLSVDWQSTALHKQVSAIWISNVAGAAMREHLLSQLQAIFANVPVHWFQSQARCAGVINQYRQPTQLGCDRFASAIGAHFLYPDSDKLVATCGTATTVDAVTKAGEFAGGMILPGLKLMAESLARNTAQLPQVAESIGVSQPFADNTDQAIVSGCIHAQAGAIRMAYQALQARGKDSAAAQLAPVCLISGGAAPYLTPHLGFSALHVPNLVLTGLLVVAQSSPI